MQTNLALSLTIIVLVFMTSCTVNSSVEPELEVDTGINPVMRYDVVRLPGNATVLDVKGDVFFAIKDKGFVKAKVNDPVFNNTVLSIGEGAYVLLGCNKEKCVEFSPAPKSRWIKFTID
jgi:hypothetical protein